MHWSPERMDRLERAIVEGTRVQLFRRGSEFVVIPRELVSRGGREFLVATTYAGRDLSFALDELEDFDVIW